MSICTAPLRKHLECNVLQRRHHSGEGKTLQLCGYKYHQGYECQ